MEKLTSPPPNVTDAGKKYSVTVHTSRGDFVIDLIDPMVAPQTVNNFVYLAQNHYYDGLTQSVVAERIGVSQMHVSRLLKTSLRRMRREGERNGRANVA